MESYSNTFGGLDISSGRRPFTLAVLDNDLQVIAIQYCTIPEAISLMEGYNIFRLAINVPGSKPGQALYSDLKKKLKPAGFIPGSRSNGNRKWYEINSQTCYRAIRNELFPRRTLEGRIQRALILYEEGLQIQDPMDFFEEITRHKLLQGNLPDENMLSMKHLDALIAGYVSWLAVHRPHRMEILDDQIVPRITDHD